MTYSFEEIRLLGQLEPSSIIASILNNPPENFKARCINKTPIFFAEYDLCTTLDREVQRKIPTNKIFLRCLHFFTNFKTYFVGTTASEYVLLSARDNESIISLVDALVEEFRNNSSELMIVKDIPLDSPFFGIEENKYFELLKLECLKHNFQIVSGQALAYVPVNYTSVDDYLLRVSHARRKNIRRKLRSKKELTIVEVKTGDRAVLSEPLLDEFFGLYEAVYEQSEIHFDKLTKKLSSRSIS